MTQLEDFRSHLAESDAAARETARARLRTAQQAGPERPARSASPRGRRVRRATAAAVVLAVAVAAVLVGVDMGDDDGFSPVGPAPASARTVLVDAAQSAAEAHDGGIPRIPWPDEYFYLEIRGTYRDGGAGVGHPTTLNTRTYRRWQSFTRPGRIDTGTTTPGGAAVPATIGRLRMHIGNERFSAEQLAAFDPAPRALYDRLLNGIEPGQGSSPEAEVFVQIVDALRDVPLPPRLRATFLRALAEIPGLVLTGVTHDRLGRPGVGVAYVERSRESQRHTLVLSDGGALLASGTRTAGGKLLEDTVIVHQAITTSLEPPPDQASAP